MKLPELNSVVFEFDGWFKHNHHYRIQRLDETIIAIAIVDQYHSYLHDLNGKNIVVIRNAVIYEATSADILEWKSKWPKS